MHADDSNHAGTNSDGTCTQQTLPISARTGELLSFDDSPSPQGEPESGFELSDIAEEMEATSSDPSALERLRLTFTPVDR